MLKAYFTFERRWSCGIVTYGRSREFRMHMKNPAQTGSGCIRFIDWIFFEWNKCLWVIVLNISLLDLKNTLQYSIIGNSLYLHFLVLPSYPKAKRLEKFSIYSNFTITNFRWFVCTIMTVVFPITFPFL